MNDAGVRRATLLLKERRRAPLYYIIREHTQFAAFLGLVELRQPPAAGGAIRKAESIGAEWRGRYVTRRVRARKKISLPSRSPRVLRGWKMSERLATRPRSVQCLVSAPPE